MSGFYQFSVLDLSILRFWICRSGDFPISNPEILGFFEKYILRIVLETWCSTIVSFGDRTVLVPSVSRAIQRHRKQSRAPPKIFSCVSNCSWRSTIVSWDPWAQADAACSSSSKLSKYLDFGKIVWTSENYFEHLQTLGKSVFKPERAGAAVLEHLQTSENSNRALLQVWKYDY